jgi:hypothetical protein
VSLLRPISLFPRPPSQAVLAERAGYTPTKGGFFLSEYGGGRKLAQIYLQMRAQESLLSDELLKRGQTVMTLLIIGNDCASEEFNVKAILRAANLHPSVISEHSLLFIRPDKDSEQETFVTESQKIERYYPTSRKDLDEKKIRPGYNESSYFRRLGRATKYAIIRPDFIVFSAAKSLLELERCLQLLKARLVQQVET